jgi:hypothetical protein
VVVAVVVEDALQPAVSEAAIKPIAATSDGQRFTRTRFDASLGIVTDFCRSLAKKRSGAELSKSYSKEYVADQQGRRRITGDARKDCP